MLRVVARAERRTGTRCGRTPCTSGTPRCSRGPFRRGRGSARCRGTRTGSRPPAAWYRRLDGWRAHAEGDLGAAGMAPAGADRPASCPTRDPLHGVRDLVPRGPDRRRCSPGARARAAARRDADVLVVISHEGTRADAGGGPGLAGSEVGDHGRAGQPAAAACDEVVVATPEIEQSWCHTASYTCAVAALAALRGEDMSWLSDAVEEALERPALGDRARALADRGRRARLADGAGGGAEASRGRVPAGRVAPHRAAAPRLSRGGRREGALLRARG